VPGARMETPPGSRLLIQPPQALTRGDPSNREGVAEDRTLPFSGAPLATRPLHRLVGRPTGTVPKVPKEPLLVIILIFLFGGGFSLYRR